MYVFFTWDYTIPFTPTVGFHTNTSPGIFPYQHTPHAPFFSLVCHLSIKQMYHEGFNQSPNGGHYVSTFSPKLQTIL